MNLEGDKRLNIQLRLDFPSAPTGEARQAGREDIESPSVASEPERPANTSRIMEEVCERANLKEALRQVRSNKGSAGVDRMTVDQLGDYLGSPTRTPRMAFSFPGLRPVAAPAGSPWSAMPPRSRPASGSRRPATGSTTVLTVSNSKPGSSKPLLLR